ncbi:MAG: YiaA/YiaB family inner membrane protein [Capsulimonadales bacterium]|nr:YiaA/YiaB family inner membrane protein [Capsulimonadales bacterium]
MEQPGLNQDSPAFIAFTQITFALSLIAMVVGIWDLPVEVRIRGYLCMGLFFVISSTIVLSKTLRDRHEARKIVNKINEVKTERILKEFELK